MVELLQKKWLFNKRFVFAKCASGRTGEKIFCNLVVQFGRTTNFLMEKKFGITSSK